MPTRLPRLNVTVTEDQHRLLLRLGELQGRSAASYLREFLDAATPMLLTLLPIIERAKAGELETASEQAKVMEDLARSLFEGAETGQLDMLEYISGVVRADGSGGAEKGSQAQSGRQEHCACEPADALPTPPSSNTGVSSGGPARSRRVSKAVAGGSHG